MKYPIFIPLEIIYKSTNILYALNDSKLYELILKNNGLNDKLLDVSVVAGEDTFKDIAMFSDKLIKVPLSSAS